MKKKNLLFMVTMLLSGLSGFAQTSNKCGDNLYWSYDFSTNQLIITGTGDMYNYSDTSYPWFSYRENITSLSLPDGITSIGNHAFHYCTSITSLTIGNSVTEIGDYAFYGCKFTSLTIPESVTSIGMDAFSYCSSLTTVNFNATNCTDKSIWDAPFTNCEALSTVNIGDKVKNIPSYTFYQCTSLKSLTIGNSVTSIDGYAFKYCRGLTSLFIPNSVTSIGYNAFEGCTGITSLTIGNSVTSIGDFAFSGCSGLTSLTIPNSVTSIGSYAFSDSGLTSLTIGNSVTSIGDFAFSACSGLTSLTIPESVTLIGDFAFYSSKFTQITSNPTTPPTIYSYTFECTDEDIPIKVPCDHVNDYKTAQYWKDFTNYQCISTGIKENKIQKFQIYPNPAKDEIFIKTELPIKKIEICDMSGRIVEIWHAASLQNGIPKISVSSLSKGVYMVKVYTDSGLVTEKVVKE